MGFFDFLRPRKRSEQTGNPGPLDEFWYTALNSLLKPAGEVVTPKTAQQVAAVFACVQAISESFAMIPARVKRQVTDRKTEDASTHALNELLRIAANPNTDAFSYKETMAANCALHGNAVSHVQRSVTGRLLALTPLVPERVSFAAGSDGRLQYKHSVGGSTETYNADEIFHYRDRSEDGLIGKSRIATVAPVIGFALALQRHGNSLFQNGAFHSGFVKVPVKLKDDEARQQLIDSFKKYMGARNAGQVGLLEQGTEFVPGTQTNRDAQFLESKALSAVDIARIYRCPPQMIQEMEKGMSFASVEQIAIFFVNYTLQPWITRFEAAANHQLLTEAERRRGLFLKFNIDALLRGDLKARTEALVQQLQYGLMTINEGRNLLDRNPAESEVADEILLSHNVVPASTILDPEEELEAEPEEQDEESDSEFLASRAELRAIRSRLERLEAVESADVTERPDPRAAFLPLLTEEFDRLLRSETKAIRRALKKEKPMLAANAFYERHAPLMRGVLAPVMAAYAAVRGLEPNSAVDEFLTAHLSERAERIVDAAAAGELAELPVDDWRASAGMLAQELLRIFEGGEHVRPTS